MKIHFSRQICDGYVYHEKTVFWFLELKAVPIDPASRLKMWLIQLLTWGGGGDGAPGVKSNQVPQVLTMNRGWDTGFPLAFLYNEILPLTNLSVSRCTVAIPPESHTNLSFPLPNFTAP